MLQRKYTESKSESNGAQNTLEKEITTLRDTNRTLQHKLRDIEVANDDFERQARHTNSSLEDLESKYNAAIERAVMMEEEIRIGEQERENLRIEVQRLREELSDLKIEAEILNDKLKKHDLRHMSVISTDLSIPESPMFDSSIMSGAMSGSSSPLVNTPPETSSVSSNKTPVNEPPSPPMSDASAPPPLPKTRVPPIKAPTPASKPGRSRLPSMDPSTTRRPRLSSVASTTTTASSRPPTRANTVAGARTGNTPTAPRSATKTPATTRGVKGGKLPPSNSLTHIRSLTAQMQRLEARVHTARSRLPAPAPTPPRVSPVGHNNITIRSSRKRGSVSSVSTHLTAPDDTTPTGQGFGRSVNGKHVPRLSSSGVSRLSFGPGPLPNRGPHDEISRPSSRASNSSYARSVSRVGSHYDSMIAPPRPGSRAGGAYTPRPISRASFGSSYHGHSMSISTAEEEEPAETIYRTPSRRGTFSRLDAASGIPTPSGIPMPSSRRASAVSATMDFGGGGRRPSITPKLGKKASTQFADLGETY